MTKNLEHIIATLEKNKGKSYVKAHMNCNGVKQYKLMDMKHNNILVMRCKDFELLKDQFESTKVSGFTVFIYKPKSNT